MTSRQAKTRSDNKNRFSEQVEIAMKI